VHELLAHLPGCTVSHGPGREISISCGQHDKVTVLSALLASDHLFNDLHIQEHRWRTCFSATRRRRTMAFMPAIELRPILVIARKEFWDRLRNRWVLAIAAIFTVFALVIAYFGAAQGGAVGFQNMDVTIVSLVSLVIYIVPLIALILGYDAVVGEGERGTLDLLLSQPLTRLELLLGKY